MPSTSIKPCKLTHIAWRLISTDEVRMTLICIMTPLPSKGILRPVALGVKAKSRTNCRVSTNLITVYWLMETGKISGVDTVQLQSLGICKAQRTWKSHNKKKKTWSYINLINKPGKKRTLWLIWALHACVYRNVAQNEHHNESCLALNGLE